MTVYLMTHIAKVEVIGGSDKGWSEAAQATLDEAKKDYSWNYWVRSK
jgi:flavin-binding protein dodecin